MDFELCFRRFMKADSNVCTFSVTTFYIAGWNQNNTFSRRLDCWVVGWIPQCAVMLHPPPQFLSFFFCLFSRLCFFSLLCHFQNGTTWTKRVYARSVQEASMRALSFCTHIFSKPTQPDRAAVYCSSFTSCAASSKTLIGSASSTVCAGGVCAASQCCVGNHFSVGKPTLPLRGHCSSLESLRWGCDQTSFEAWAESAFRRCRKIQSAVRFERALYEWQKMLASRMMRTGRPKIPSWLCPHSKYRVFDKHNP